MRHLLALAALLGCLGACTAQNPEYEPGNGDGGIADLTGSEGSDLSDPPTDVDLADPGSIDMSRPPECKTEMRSCRTSAGRSFSRYCRAGFFADDRACPTDSICKDGYCQVPPRTMTSAAGSPCGVEGDCTRFNTEYTCTPFVVNVMGRLDVQTFYAKPKGMGGSGTQCKPMDSSPCRSGFCDQVSYNRNGTDFNYCFRRCARSSDCPNNSFACRSPRVLVEGQLFTNNGNNLGSCIPN